LIKPAYYIYLNFGVLNRQMTRTDCSVFIALPVMDEQANLPGFIRCLELQTYRDFKLYICVNQPDEWWGSEEQLAVCLSNQNSMEYLNSIESVQLIIIDKSSKGNGWTGKKSGVGWARRTLMDTILKEANQDDLIISLDADTSFNPGYFESVVENFIVNNNAVALAVPYYHQLTGEHEKDRAILRYEIYMRYYAINLWRIQSPYSFTAIGSAIVLPVKAYRAIGGITPHKSGEDFYFLQKLRKYGKVLTWNAEKVCPEARYSDRVGFGTGPAMIRGRAGDWDRYPIYPSEFFDSIKQTTGLFPDLFEKDLSTPMDEFINEKFRGVNIWQPLRNNSKTKKQFVRACFHKLDAFRMLQYLKWRYVENNRSDEENLLNWLQNYYPGDMVSGDLYNESLSFTDTQVSDLDRIRNILVKIEEKYQENEEISII